MQMDLAAMCTPPISNGSLDIRPMAHAGGYSRMASAKHHFGVAELRQVGELRSTAGQHRIDFLVQPRFAFRILRQQIPGPGKRIRRGLVAGQKQRQGFVPHLSIGHARAIGFLVLRQ